MAWENSENLDFTWKYPKYPHIFCPASLVKFGEKWDTLLCKCSNREVSAASQQINYGDEYPLLSAQPSDCWTDSPAQLLQNSYRSLIIDVFCNILMSIFIIWTDEVMSLNKGNRNRPLLTRLFFSLRTPT